jgi:alkylation response protein AidB-like acyl-CoA dehydrogenase
MSQSLQFESTQMHTRANGASSADADFAKVIEGVRRVAARAALRSQEFDDLGSIPPDLYEELELTGAFQSLTPRAYGGLELSLSHVNEILIEGARANGSLGWVMMIHVQQSLGIGTFPKETVLGVLRQHPRVRIRGVAAPKGTATPVEGGYIISGQWPFASGGPSPDFVGANCVVMEKGAPRLGAHDIPELRIAWIPAGQVEFLDTWHVIGMRGTDSRDFRVRDVFVPEEMTSDLFNIQNWFETPAARLPLRVALSPGHAAVAVGIAQGALEEIAELAKTKRAAMNPKARLADDPLFRHSLGECSLRLSASRALLDHVTADVEQVAASGRKLTPHEIMMGRGMTAYITSECVAVVDAAYNLAGSASVYNSCPLERRLRDIHVASQHISTFKELYRSLGATVLGEELSQFDLIY